MSDEFEDLLKGWLRDRGAADRSTLEALAGNVATLPPPSRRQPSNLVAAAAVIIALGLAAFALVPRNGSVSSQVNGPVSPTPSGQAAFAGDPRLAACSSDVAEVDRVFEMVKSRYFPLYFPGWWQGAPELEVDDPALVVIGREQVWPITGAAPGPGQTFDPNAGLGYQMCIAVGTPASFIAHNYGVTRFNRLVPVLSADDLARAQHMDPDVLADPANYPVPKRLAACGGITDQVQYVFEARSIDDFPRYFPAAGPLGLVTPDELATIVVYRGAIPTVLAGPAQASLGPNEHDLCILLGPDPGNVAPVFVNGVDLAGFHVRIDDAAATESPAPTPAAAPPSTTPGPAPAWVANLAGQLDCTGPLAALGGEYSYGGSPEGFGPSPDEALTTFLGPSNPYASLPATGFRKQHAELHWASYGYFVGGQRKAIIVLNDTTIYGSGWAVVALRSCDASEFDPSTPLTFPETIWTDASGHRISTETIVSVPGPGHCGWDRVTFLNVDHQLYFRDPQKIMAQWTTTRFDSAAVLPKRAVNTGYRTGKWTLWLDPGKDAYLVSPGHVERWPRSSDPFLGCA